MEAPRGAREPTGTNGPTLNNTQPTGEQQNRQAKQPQPLYKPRSTHTPTNSAGTVLNTNLVVVIAPGKRPASIPNLEAKPGSANGTATDRLWESRTPPQHNKTDRDGTATRRAVPLHSNTPTTSHQLRQCHRQRHRLRYRLCQWLRYRLRQWLRYQQRHERQRTTPARLAIHECRMQFPQHRAPPRNHTVGIATLTHTIENSPNRIACKTTPSARTSTYVGPTACAWAPHRPEARPHQQ